MKGLRIVASSVVTVAMLLSMVACGGSTPSSSSSSSEASSSKAASSSASSSSSLKASSSSSSAAASSSSSAVSSTASSTSAASSSSSSAAQKEVKKPKSLYLYLDVVIEEKDGAAQNWAQFEKDTGIKLKVVKPEHSQYSEKLSTLFMSKDIPDVVEVLPTDYMKYASQKAFAPLGEYIKNSAVMSKIDPKAINALSYRGEIYGVQKENGNGSLTYIRKDWLDKLKLNVPKTYDEFYNMLVAFRDKDPDGNGVNIDSIGYTLSLKNPDNELYLTDLLIDAHFNFYKKGGKWVDGFAEDAMLKALERMATLYQQKLIEPEIFTLATADCRNKFYTGNTGCFAYWAGTWNDNINRELQKNIKGASVVPMPALPGGYFINRVSPCFAIPAKPACGDPAAVFKYFIEYVYDGGKGTMWATSGVEGVHYKIENGKAVALPAPSTPDKPRLYPVKVMMEGTLEIVPNPGYTFPIPEVWKQSAEIFNQHAISQELIPPTKAYNTVAAELYLLRQETVAKVMKGELAPTAAMERYKSETAKMGIDNILAELNSF
ncbi:MAG TPA: hypothetical protein DCP97_04395 [Ruminococcaceae bacterium]|nr:hypothetical protein [Oscillospiraceae bacterium]